MLFVFRGLFARGQSSVDSRRSHKRERVVARYQRRQLGGSITLKTTPRQFFVHFRSEKNWDLHDIKNHKNWTSLTEEVFKKIFEKIFKEINFREFWKEKLTEKMGSGGSRLEPSLEIKTYPKFEAVTCSAQGWRPSRYRRANTVSIHLLWFLARIFRAKVIKKFQ